jgi:hypothetical protein
MYGEMIEVKGVPKEKQWRRLSFVETIRVEKSLGVRGFIAWRWWEEKVVEIAKAAGLLNHPILKKSGISEYGTLE